MKFLKIFLIVIIAIVILVIGAGIFKFTILASLPGYNVDGNKIETEK